MFIILCTYICIICDYNIHLECLIHVYRVNYLGYFVLAIRLSAALRSATQHAMSRKLSEKYNITLL